MEEDRDDEADDVAAEIGNALAAERADEPDDDDAAAAAFWGDRGSAGGFCASDLEGDRGEARGDPTGEATAAMAARKAGEVGCRPRWSSLAYWLMSCEANTRRVRGRGSDDRARGERERGRQKQEQLINKMRGTWWRGAIHQTKASVLWHLTQAGLTMAPLPRLQLM